MASLKSFNHSKKESGFTFIELILYTAIVAIFLTGAVYFAWDIVYAQVRSNIEQETIENARIVVQRIQSEIRSADDIINISLSSLELDSGPLGTTIIALDGDVIKITQSEATSELTSSQMEISELLFSDLSSGDEKSKNIEFSLTLRHKNPASRKEWEKSYTIKTSAEIRSN